MLFKNHDELIENGKDEKIKQIRKDVLSILSHSIDAVDPYNSVKNVFFSKEFKLFDKDIDLSEFSNMYLVGFGKASIGMADAVSDSVDIKEGIVVTNQKDKKVKNKKIKTFVGGHPIPNENSLKAADEIINLVKKANKDDLLFVLISGGGSALLCKPRAELDDIQKITNLLLKCGADIREINTIRKHLSYVKGGQLVKNVKSKVISLVISDIVGDPLDFIASGPTYPDSTTYKDAKYILEKYDIWDKIPGSIKEIITKGINGKISETPDEKDPIFENVENLIVANNTLACKSAIEKAEDLGYKTMLLTTRLEGEARDVATFLVDKTINYENSSEKMIFVSGGETTVTLKGNGKGGRNQEMVLSSIEKISDKNILFCSFATDGIDGDSDAAGAIADTYSFRRAEKSSIDPDLFLDDNNSYEFFNTLNDLLLTGPTGTNVMDLQIIVKYK